MKLRVLIKKSVLSLFFFAFLFNLKTSAAEVNINSTWQSKALVSIQQLQGAELWVGGSVGVVTAQGDASTEFSGEATLGSGLKPDQDSIFEIGSLSKSFVGIILAFLSESEPTLSIDDSIDKYLPELLGTFSGRITLRQLATHTSGLPRLPCTDPKTSYCFHPREWRNPYSDYSEAALLDYLKQFNRKDVGPYQEDYSNTGFAVLGLVVTRIKSTKFDSLLSEIITGPLGMNQTRVLRPGLMVSNFLKPYDIDRAEVLHWEWAVFAPAGGIISSSRDMIKFLKANVNPPDSALGRAIQKSQKLGLGWDSAPGAAVVFKNGMTAGFKAMVLIDHRVNAGVYVLSNMGSSYGDSVAWSVLGDKIQDLVGLELSKDELARYKGEYKSDYGPEKGEGNGSDLLTVAGSGKFLILEFQDKKLRLNPKAFHEFNGFDGVHQNGYHKVSFQQDDSGRVYQTVLHLQVEKGKFVDLTFQRVSPY